MPKTNEQPLTLVSSWKELEELIDALLLRISDTDLHLAAMHFAREGEE